MKIIVIGASGRVASRLIEKLADQGHAVLACSRHPESIVKGDKIQTEKLDLHDSVEKIAMTIGQADLIYFVAGSRGKDLLQTDAFGALKTMQAAEKNHIKRYIMLSTAASLEPEKWDSPAIQSILNYQIAKFFADNYLMSNTQLDYTILQPVSLLEEAEIGRVSLAPSLSTTMSSTNTIGDVAAVLAEIPKHDNTIKKVIAMSQGDSPIVDALEIL